MKNNNVLIAEFMGYKLVSCNNGRAWEYTLSKKAIDDVFNLHGRLLRKENNYMKYDTDWNWLMPVVGKIESLPLFMVRIEENVCRITDLETYDKTTNFDGGKLITTYTAIVEFINWYNKQN